MAARIGIGLIGAGRMGAIHARLIAARIPEARLVGIADVNLESAQRLATELGDLPAYSSTDELLRTPGLDAVLIATWSATHRAAIEAAAAAGKDILCEKPIALTLDETDAAIGAVERRAFASKSASCAAGTPTTRGPSFGLASGDLGRPMLFKSLQFDPGPPPVSYADPAVSGGIMVDLGIHEFDLARWLMDDEVVEVHAFGSSVSHPELADVNDVDSAVIDLRFAGGTTGSVELARNTTYGEDVRTEVLATAGSVWVGHLPVSHGSWSGGSAGEAVARDSADPTVPRFETAYAAQTRAFVHAIQEGRQIEVGADEARAAMAISLAAIRSMREGGTVVLD